MTRTDDRFEVFFVVVVLAVAQFNGTNLSGLGIKPEVVVEAPPVVTKALFNFEARREFVVITRHVRHSDPGKEVRLAVCIVGLGEHPGELESRLDDDHRFVPFLKTD